MVTISGYAERESADGKKFYALVLQGGMEMVLSEESGRYYATAKQASITSTFDEPTCKSLIGTKLPGRITRIQCDPYEYTVRETGEILTLNHRWTYNPNEAALDEMVYEKEPLSVEFAQ
ncbi:MAG: hypothetical protein MUC78_05805 [Bacteroidales bacterium]|nr:hypothetical protein [Bacteroidales bacterium]